MKVLGNRLSSLWKQLDLYKRVLHQRASLLSDCWVCGETALEDLALCKGCVRDLPLRADPFLRRGLSSVDRAIAPFRYAFPITNLVRAAKFSRDLCALKVLGDLLCLYAGKALGDSDVDLLVPIPLSRFRFVQRGFNQATELARALSAETSIEFTCSLLKRGQFWATPQSKLDASARARNVMGAFQLNAIKRNIEHVALIDDVLTTGATCMAAAHALREVGVAKVTVVAVAATPRASDMSKSGV